MSVAANARFTFTTRSARWASEIAFGRAVSSWRTRTASEVSLARSQLTFETAAITDHFPNLTPHALRPRPSVRNHAGPHLSSEHGSLWE